MITIHVATLDTRNFSFEAYGGTQGEARDALAAVLVRHAETYRIPTDWWRQDEDGIEVRAVTLGVGYRDRQVI